MQHPKRHLRNQIGGGWAELAVLMGIGLIVAAIFTGSVYWQMTTITNHCKSEPTEITATDLANNGPPSDNLYVHVTNYQLQDVKIIKGRSAGSPWLQYVKADVVPNPPANPNANTLTVKNHLADAGKMTQDREAAAQSWCNETSFNAIAQLDQKKNVINLVVSKGPAAAPEVEEMMSYGAMATAGFFAAIVVCIMLDNGSKSRRR